jgi:hypothetical protein
VGSFADDGIDSFRKIFNEIVEAHKRTDLFHLFTRGIRFIEGNIVEERCMKNMGVLRYIGKLVLPRRAAQCWHNVIV